ncbi:MAG: ResB protein required for cytochrome C biosynthesis [Verrucomicrobia bacterium]|nr:MAG: ResB protein required for cytochrome C biosynthesis [Verrucomicrobiota bacterium]
MLERLYRIFTSLKLTVVLLALGLILIFWGTLAQVHQGLYDVQNEFFRSFFIYWHPAGSSARIPIFPGGYFVGGLLLINLFSAHLRYYKPGARKIGIAMIHLGVVLLLLGQFLTDMLSSESTMHIRAGETKNYAEASRSFELAVVDTTDSDSDKVVAIPAKLLAGGGTIAHAEMPFTIKVKKFFVNSSLSEQSTNGFAATGADAGFGADLYWVELPHETAMDARDTPSATVEFMGKSGSLGTYLVSGFLRSQQFEADGRTYDLALRPVRFYKPFALQLIEFRHDKYAGTDIPMNFSSRVRLLRPDKGEDREINIYMNNPLRYAGETYYQASFDRDDQGTILQVVHNPSWLTPYFACLLVAFGMIWQFATHLLGFARKQKAT